MSASVESYVSMSVAALCDELMRGAYESFGVAKDKSDPLYDSLRRHIEERGRHDGRINELAGMLPSGFFSMQRTILDLGSGPGTFALSLNARGHLAYGIDTDPLKIALAHAHVSEAGNPDEFARRVTLADGGSLPFATESFDLISSYHVLEHVSDLRSVLYEAVRVTKPGGFIHLQAPDYRFSYDTHYCMPWPRMMPPEQAASWCQAMGRPTAGIETIYRVTAPEVLAIVEALDCTVVGFLMREYRDSQVFAHDNRIPRDPIIFGPDVDIESIASQLRELQAAGTLPNVYKTCLEFTILAQRNTRQ